MLKHITFTNWELAILPYLFNDVSSDKISWFDVFDSTKDPSTNYQSDLFTESLDLKCLKKPPSSFLNDLHNLKFYQEFSRFASNVLCHNNQTKFDILYDFYRSYSKNFKIIHNPLEPNLHKLKVFSKQVTRDIHKMQAFVRFNEFSKDGKVIYVAYHKPDHYILKKNYKFFVERFNTMNWIIFTPYAMLSWNSHQVFYQEQEYHPKTLPEDPFVELWQTYFSNIFNPARVKINAMMKEMPRRYWETMPETKLIPELIRNASTRVESMKLRSRSTRSDAKIYTEGVASLNDLRIKLLQCNACELCELNTNPVAGAGLPTSQIMILGEAPGDMEEVSGKPFVGPAGNLLGITLKKLGYNIDDFYKTNAVKHFNFRSGGKVRIHKTPSSKHILSCRPWLEKEVELVKPEVIICMGLSAAHSVLGFPVRMETVRSKLHKTGFCNKTFITHHPARILREPDLSKKEALQDQFEQDLQNALERNTSL